MFIKKAKHGLAQLKKVILPPRFDGWLRVYLTLKCNLNCPYCVHNHNLNDSKALDYQMASWRQWAEFINQTRRNVIFTGGEPFLYPNFIELLNAINREIKVKIYTNLGADLQSFTRDCKKPVTFFATYHPSSGPLENFINTINRIRTAGKFKGNIHMVGWSKQRNFVSEAKETFAKNKWYVYIDDDQYLLANCSSLKFRKKAQCTRRIYLIAPDGRRFLCVSKMLRQIDALGNVFERGLGQELITVKCEEYGYCNPCDSLGETTMKVLGE